MYKENKTNVRYDLFEGGLALVSFILFYSISFRTFLRIRRAFFAKAANISRAPFFGNRSQNTAVKGANDKAHDTAS